MSNHLTAVDNVMEHSRLPSLASTGVSRTRHHQDIGSARRDGLYATASRREGVAYTPRCLSEKNAKIGSLARRQEACKK